MTEYKMVSYWTSGIENETPEKIYEDDGFILIAGYYNHKHNYKNQKALGIHWNGNYPNSHGILSPCVIPEKARTAMLTGLLQQAIIDNDKEKMTSLNKAIHFFID
ncbi:hypothetical protein [Pasteurella atlantica]|uniref:hypothetical protein n=1 Tax=Pasteurellaceae TaxID=712 RepID=UPI00276AB4CB|nr:hypothetical protein [Pasteurella atlantica]MDP8099042.1 hypothetical protein [Pasteurella atlantica]MDP8107069.1 hypothetical protein [Pasteurella atlantica]MDP8116759.1 hypothetical protein [Pasteurella atlantica]